jgi:hypothetical protein
MQIKTHVIGLDFDKAREKDKMMTHKTGRQEQRPLG